MHKCWKDKKEENLLKSENNIKKNVEIPLIIKWVIGTSYNELHG